MKKIHAAGEVIDSRYEIIRYIDEGGMQEVYLAFDKNIERQVALKTPKNLSASKRFQRSALASSKINHSSVARTLDYFIFNEREYLIEEFINGDTLGSIFTGNFSYLDPLMVAHIGNHLVRGVSASHRVNVIHRDLKPTNIMIVGNIGFENIKITDFGVARLVDDELKQIKSDDVESSILASKTLVGAVPYMAPEILLGQEESKLSSDIWSIGALLFYLLTGKTPYSMSLTNVIISYSQKLPVPEIPLLGTLIHSRELSDQLYNIILSCMNYDSDKRPTAEQLVVAFAELCYTVKKRETGTVYNFFGRGDQGYAFAYQDGSGESIFLHMDEVFGEKPRIGDRICFSAYPGKPRPRAFPIVKCK